jgi:zinc transporter 6
VSTLEGVLEVRNEHFWTVGFGSLVRIPGYRLHGDQSAWQHVIAQINTIIDQWLHVFP